MTIYVCLYVARESQEEEKRRRHNDT
jgi:hypothetical protein